MLNRRSLSLRAALMLCVASLSAANALAGEVPAAQLAQIKQKLTQNLPEFPPIDSAQTTPMNGLIELRSGNNIIYTDTKGDYIIQGNLVETKTQRNLTEERMDEINKIDFAALPFKDAIVWKNGSGKRRLVVFADPSCGYCKRLEKDLQQIKDVTVYTFVIAILGDDSKVKANDIWCVKDRTQAWRDWMLAGTVPAKAFGMCATPIQRNLTLSQKLHVNGTPAMFFEDGSRLASAAPANVIEQRLQKASSKVQ
ncbi:MAG: DsbC family protein [Burkholderiales bacterium]|nr:DsbC family protein [Burkholderiales bacterium]